MSLKRKLSNKEVHDLAIKKADIYMWHPFRANIIWKKYLENKNLIIRANCPFCERYPGDCRSCPLRYTKYNNLCVKWSNHKHNIFNLFKIKKLTKEWLKENK